MRIRTGLKPLPFKDFMRETLKTGVKVTHRDRDVTLENIDTFSEKQLRNTIVHGVRIK